MRHRHHCASAGQKAAGALGLAHAVAQGLLGADQSRILLASGVEHEQDKQLAAAVAFPDKGKLTRAPFYCRTDTECWDAEEDQWDMHTHVGLRDPEYWRDVEQ